MLADVRLTVRDERADERRGDAERGDPVALDEIPQPVRRIVGSPVVQEDRCSERSRSDDLPGPHDPSEVGHPAQDLVLM